MNSGNIAWDSYDICEKWSGYNLSRQKLHLVLSQSSLRAITLVFLTLNCQKNSWPGYETTLSGYYSERCSQVRRNLLLAVRNALLLCFKLVGILVYHEMAQLNMLTTEPTIGSTSTALILQWCLEWTINPELRSISHTVNFLMRSGLGLSF